MFFVRSNIHETKNCLPSTLGSDFLGVFFTGGVGLSGNSGL